MAECVLTDTWPLSYTYWIPYLAFETVLFVLAISKAIMSLREQELHFANFCGTHVMKTFEVLIRDSILYFMLCVGICRGSVYAGCGANSLFVTKYICSVPRQPPRMDD